MLPIIIDAVDGTESGMGITGWADLGSPLRLRRRDLRLSQRDLAARAGVSQATVRRLESGQTDVRLDLVLAVLRAAGLRFDVRRLDDAPLAVTAEGLADLDRPDSGGCRRMPAHLPHARVRGLPYWTFARRDRAGDRITAPAILDHSEQWVYRRRPPLPTRNDHETGEATALCQAGAMEVIQHRFYRDLASWWPLISPVEEYEEEAAFVATLLHSAGIGVRDVLELGSGGGHNAAHLSRHFAMTLVDLSPEMLEVSRALNPQCRHVQGDMRTVRLGEQFDAVFVHDAVDYMVTEEDLRAAVTTAFSHCRPGGMAVFTPDYVRETFRAGSGQGGVDGDDGRGARLLEWTWDPDPADTWIVTTYVFVLRHPDGRLELAQETHRTGLFPRDTWLAVLTDAGFEASAVEEETEEDRHPRTIFIGHRPRG